MANIDFDKKFSEFVSSSDGSAIRDIYDIIPSLSNEQIRVINLLEYYISKYNLTDLEEYLNSYLRSIKKNKNLNFLSTMNMKNLLKAYTQDELIRGIKVNANSNNNEVS